ncbi:aconitate hydratase [Clostridium formicaceticum]|uniref:2,3-dimethylmalate dehydratase large subunit n=1 Tax=Clostridium formicaceticum TaxID=1497 RepID=A0AAC9RIR1_9CLOT|nr:aconitate hydratase [Clostridium formicaceticum]AOY75908.1 aconitate hydratase [Clostridium formicaceticum]ARE86252.1 2,3-dimethylmalate dehydratase large subunit [Clostridium formicaceticum]
MGKNLTYKILEDHLISGTLTPGEEIAIKVDQTLTQDSTGTMVYLQLEAMGIKEIKTELSVAYIDHNTLQTGFENADDHEFIKTVAEKYGVIFSKPGNGICHQLHLENFSVPGKTLIGSDSHTPTSGGMGVLAIGTGGLDVAAGMASGKYYLKAPKVVNIQLKGSLNPWVSAKDVILYVLKKLTVKGGVGKVIEYSGEGVKSLSLTDRATITNMGAELGATTSIFPSDEITRAFLKANGREESWKPLAADEDATYDEIIEIDLSNIPTLTAKPHSPDNVDAVDAVKGLKIDQVLIGSCTNSSYKDLMKAAAILKGKKVHPDVSLGISPGSSTILKMLADNGALSTFIAAGARILECSCGPCIGMGQSPKTDSVSLRTFNRNFCGRSGTKSADVYLVSPETAAISAVKGYFEDPVTLGEDIIIEEPTTYDISDNYFVRGKNIDATVVMGPNIKPFPTKEALTDGLEGKVVLKTGDNITTDDIMPSNAKLLPYRSNIPHLSKFCFHALDEKLWEKCELYGGGFIIGGDNYGQGSSREHAALVPLYLGIKAILAKSFARIHKANLINSGIIPLEFVDANDYASIGEMDELEIKDVKTALISKDIIEINNKTKNLTIKAKFVGSQRDIDILLLGGYLNYIKMNLGE